MTCSTFNDVQYKVERNKWGRVILSPRNNNYGILQFEIGSLLKNKFPSGRVIMDCAIETPEGVRVADLVWASDAYESAIRLETPVKKAPEVCVDIASPLTTNEELDERVQLYFLSGAEEVWIVDESGIKNFYAQVINHDSREKGSTEEEVLTLLKSAEVEVRAPIRYSARCGQEKIDSHRSVVISCKAKGEEFNSNWPISPLTTLIRHLRADIIESLPLDNIESLYQWLVWLVINGREEYPSINQDQAFIKFLSKPSDLRGMTVLQRVIYTLRRDIQTVYSWPDDIQKFHQWFEKHGVFEHDLHPLLELSERRDLEDKSSYEFGVNLIGYVYGQLGIGEDLRMTARALMANDVPFTIINQSPGKTIPQNDYSLKEHVSEDGNYAINLICMTAFESGIYFAKKGEKQCRGRYNIGYWPWELNEWPKEWLPMMELVDEVWVSTRHIYDALVPVCPVPVLIMPLAVEIGEISPKTRQDFGLPEHAKLFCFAFDFNSSIYRKNPQACVEAFNKAFGNPNRYPDIGLVIKVHKPLGPNKAWERIREVADQDVRIHLIEGTLDRADVLALYKCCDCFLSLHRAEGYGRGLAEAIQLGLHVIATGYSGNVDFCYRPYVDLVDYSLIPVGKEEYQYGEGMMWADPDIEHAAKLMRNFVQSHHEGSIHSMPEMISKFSPSETGKIYKRRLDFLKNEVNKKDLEISRVFK